LRSTKILKKTPFRQKAPDHGEDQQSDFFQINCTLLLLAALFRTSSLIVLSLLRSRRSALSVYFLAQPLAQRDLLCAATTRLYPIIRSDKASVPQRGTNMELALADSHALNVRLRRPR
jgi:hypothetical protein